MKKIISMFMAMAVAVCYIAPANLAVADAAKAMEQGEEISIMFTEDINGRMDEKEILLNGKQQDVGGFARVETVKEEIEEKYPETLLVDAGGFSMGTAFQTIDKTEAPELVTMGEIGYDAVALGHQEFGFSATGTADMLNATVERSDSEKLPAITGLNINWGETLKDKKTAKAGDKLLDAFHNYGVEDYTIVQKNGARIAVFGVMDPETIGAATPAQIHFSDSIERAEEIVGEIMRNDEADFVVCLNHGSAKETELAKAVKGIDLIVSSDGKKPYKEPKKVGNTMIVSCGENNTNVGHIVLEYKENQYKLKEYNLMPLDESVDEDSHIHSMVNSYKSRVDSAYFGDYGYSYGEKLAENDIGFTAIENLGKEQKEEPLANLIGDGYRDTINQLEKNKDTKKSNKDKVAVAIVPVSTIGDTFVKGDITVADVFDVSNIGVGPDGHPGMPAVSFYLNGKELKNLVEIDASISNKTPKARMYTSGLAYTINSHRLPLNKATGIHLQNENGKAEKIDNKKLYRIVTDLNTCETLTKVGKYSHNLLNVKPKNKDGKEISDFGQAIMLDDHGHEIKAWTLVADYMDDFDNNQVPKYYNKTQNRKIIDNSFNPVKIFKEPNHIATMILAIALIPIVIIIGIIVAIVRNRQRRRGYRKSMFSGSRNRTYTRTMGSRGRRPKVKNHKWSMSNNKRRTGGRKRR